MSGPSKPPQCVLEPRNLPEYLHMGSGPTPSNDISEGVTMDRRYPMTGPFLSESIQIMDDVKEGIKYAFQTTNEWTVCVSGTGHGAMETTVCNLIEENDKVLVCVNGLWGERFIDMAERHGADIAAINKPMGEVFNLQEIEEGLEKHKPRVMFITHGESSGSTVQPLEGIGALCHKYDCILIVDSVAACGGVPLYMDKWEIDAMYTGAQKVLSAPPGASPVSFSERAKKKVQSRKSKVRSYYFDMNELANYWGCDPNARRYHHTGPISSVYAIREGFARLAEIGLESSWANHKNCAEMLHAGVEDLGLELLVKDKANRLPCVTGIRVPSGVNWKDVTDYAMKNYKVEISGGLGALAGKIWRVGIMGHNATPDNVRLVLRALGEGLKQAKM